MDENKVLNALLSVLSERKGDVELISQFAGGWELWLQSEIALKFPLGDVERETAPWNDTRTCDLWFPRTRFCAELKCFGLNRAYKPGNDPRHISNIASSYQAWSNKVLRDADRIRELPSDVGGMSIAVIPTWFPQEILYLMKSQLERWTYKWEEHHGFYIAINLRQYL